MKEAKTFARIWCDKKHPMVFRLKTNYGYGPDETYEVMTAFADQQTADMEKRAKYAEKVSYDTSVQNANLMARLEAVNRLLHDLTPGGSEFYNDPEYCAKWVRENHLAAKIELTECVAKAKKELAGLKGLEDPFPLKSVLEILCVATRILLHRKNYDGPEHEEMQHCVKRAEETIEKYL
jgi:hypothetical protein